ncbi:MAG: hypothetical protein EX285_06140 [Thaumarchaeota archaeon]|nr:hypothetical protein [Nitrososphaerota archaeon]
MVLIYFFDLFFGIAIAMGIFIVFSMYIRKKTLKSIVSQSIFNIGINYVCITYEHRFKSGSCPRCSSKTRRMEF